jgi:hypothetical protein
MEFTFHLLDDRSDQVASATLELAHESQAFAKAAVHLSASAHFRAIEIRVASKLIRSVDRTQLDTLCRPTGLATS